MCLLSEVSTALVGPNSLFREGLKGILHPPYQTETIAESIDLVQAVGLHLIILIADTDQTALLAQLRHAKQLNASARVVVMGDTDSSDVIWPLLAAGADGYLLRSISLEALRVSLDAVMLGATVVSSTLRNTFTIEIADGACPDKAVVEPEIPKLAAEAEYKKLSSRETEILLCLTKGESNKQIARKFEITEATVKVHLKAILRKIRVSNRTQAAVWAHNNYVTPIPRLPQVAPADFRRGANGGTTVGKACTTVHEDRVPHNFLHERVAIARTA